MPEHSSKKNWKMPPQCTAGAAFSPGPFGMVNTCGTGVVEVVDNCKVFVSVSVVWERAYIWYIEDG
jgi:hypothetical protein